MISTPVEAEDTLRLPYAPGDYLIRFEEDGQVIGTVEVANRHRWWAPWSRRKVVVFTGNIERSAQKLLEVWVDGLAHGGCCTGA